MRRCQSKIESMKPVDTDATTTMKKMESKAKHSPHTLLSKQKKRSNTTNKQREKIKYDNT